MSKQVERRTLENTDPSEILSRCLQSIEAGEATVEGCLARYPDIPELGNLLRAVTLVQELPRPQLPPASKAEMRELALTRFRARQAMRPARRASQRSIPRWLQMAAAVSLVVAVLFSGGIGLVQAADASVPGDSLYGIKRLAERVELSVADAQARPDILYRQAMVRITEVSLLSRRGRALTDAELADFSDSINVALVAHPDTASRTFIVNTANAVLVEAESAGTLGTGKRGQVLQTLVVTPDSSAPCVVAGPEAGPSETPVPSLSPSPTGTLTVTPGQTLTPELTETMTATPTPTATPSQTVTNTPEPTGTLTADADSADGGGTKPTQKPKATQRPPRTSPTPGTGNNNPGGGKGDKK
jgi:hypothetical protein